MVKQAANKQQFERDWLRHFAGLKPDEALVELKSSRAGLTQEQAELAIEEYGTNEVYASEHKPLIIRLLLSFADPFVLILLIVATVSLLSDVIFAAPGECDAATPIIILVMVLISGILRFVQESRSQDAAKALVETIETTCNVERQGVGRREIPLDEVATGDIIHLSAGDMVPADIKIISARDLFIGQAALTGEAEAIEKSSGSVSDTQLAITDIPCLAFMGTTVISGTGVGLAIATGKRSFLGTISRASRAEKRSTSYEQGIQDVSKLLLRLMLIMAPTVFIINGLTKGDWLQSLLFAFSVAVGLTPEMLPMIVTTCLAKGAVDMSKQSVVVKRLDAIQDLGAMDVFCTDKTGTLTEDNVALERYLDVHGNDNVDVLALAFLNSFFETGLRNLIDSAIIKRAYEESETKDASINADELIDTNYLIDELPFDFERRRVSVVVGNKHGESRMITKGALEEILELCSQVEYQGKLRPLTDKLREEVMSSAIGLAESGMRVLGLALKNDPKGVGVLTTDDECDMVLMGYLAFLDPPKSSAGLAIAQLREHGVSTKVLTGDSTRVARYVCSAIGLEVTGEIEGSQIEQMSDFELEEMIEGITLFSKLSPDQKCRVISALHARGHIVGFMGDGVNDAPAMRVSDCGISVDTAVDIAKESADIILLEKDLNVLERGVENGRSTYANMSKYIRITASSNFGNIFSMLAASAFLPFLPMTAVQLLLLNLINDCVCTAIPWDNVEEDLLMSPRSWDTKGLSAFMRWIGPISSIFDIVSYLVLFFVVCPEACGGSWANIAGTDAAERFVALFQASWFIESMLTQILAILILRSGNVGAKPSMPAPALIALSLAGAALSFALVFSPAGALIDFAVPPISWLLWLLAILAGYALSAYLVRSLFAKRHPQAL